MRKSQSVSGFCRIGRISLTLKNIFVEVLDLELFEIGPSRFQIDRLSFSIYHTHLSLDEAYSFD